MKFLFRMLSLLAAIPLLNACVTAPDRSHDVRAFSREVFFVGGHYVGEKGKEVMQGAMYVEHLRPVQLTQKYPLVLFHGAAQTAVNWMSTPDGRKGWAQYFVDQGYEVYLVDQPARGRSAWHPSVDGALRNFPAPTIEMLFTTDTGPWPQSKKHTQWPGDGPQKGRMGDPIFDQFYASQVEYLASNVETQTLVQAAGAALLDRIGPAIIMTHSQAGPFGWLLADARPQLVKAVLSIEPNGPPIKASPTFGGAAQLAWGPSDIPITYSPEIKSSAELKVTQQTAPQTPELTACWRQQEPAHQLVRLKGIPMLILITEASYHAQYDHCTSEWLTQAGVINDMVRLPEIGIYGNGHMVMLEKNNLEVASWIKGWVQKNVH